jgi:magnesium transporter
MAEDQRPRARNAVAEKPRPAASASPAVQPLPQVAWYDITDPNSPALDELAQRFDLHELQIEDCRHRGQRPKTEDHERYIFTVLKQLQVNRTVTFDDLDIFLGRDYLITVHKGETPIIAKVQRRAEADQVTRLDQVLYLLVDMIVDEYIPMLDGFAEDIASIESAVLQKPEPPVLRRIFQLKRKLIEFRRVANGMREVVNTLMRREKGLVGDDLDPYFRDVYDHLVRTADLAETYRDLLTGALDIYLSAVANRTNEIMKVLAIYGTIALPLVVITGFFGMNLHLPWTQNARGVLYVCGLMGISVILVLWYFRRKGWL